MSNDTNYLIIEKYAFLTQKITIYAGIILYSLCLFGTLMNIITFSQRIYNRPPPSLYLLSASIFDFAHITLGSISNILQYGFHYDWTITSTIYCKIKIYFVYVFTIISGTLTICATIDRYILSSSNSQRWNYNTRRIAKRAILFIIIFWLIFSIPISFCSKRTYHSSNNEQMICTNPADNRFCYIVRVIYTCLLDGFVPPFLMMIFGVMAYKNVYHLYQRSQYKSISTRRINQQIILMLVFQSIKSTFASFPLSILNTYLLITKQRKKSFLQQAKENLIMQIVYFLFWSNYTSFFVYICSSDIFRNQWIKSMKKILCCLYGKRQRRFNYKIELKRLQTTKL